MVERFFFVSVLILLTPSFFLLILPSNGQSILPILSRFLANSLTHSLMQSLILSITHSVLILPLTHTVTHSLTHSHSHSFTYSQSLIHSHSFTHSFTHSLAQSHSHSFSPHSNTVTYPLIHLLLINSHSLTHSLISIFRSRPRVLLCNVQTPCDTSWAIQSHLARGQGELQITGNATSHYQIIPEK